MEEGTARHHAQGKGLKGDLGRKLRQDEQDGQDAKMEDRELTKGTGLVHGFGIRGFDGGVKWVKIRIDRLTNAGWGHPARDCASMAIRLVGSFSGAFQYVY